LVVVEGNAAVEVGIVQSALRGLHAVITAISPAWNTGDGYTMVIVKKRVFQRVGDGESLRLLATMKQRQHAKRGFVDRCKITINFIRRDFFTKMRNYTKGLAPGRQAE